MTRGKAKNDQTLFLALPLRHACFTIHNYSMDHKELEEF